MIRAYRRVIRKGDGIMVLHDGDGGWMRYPPPESLSDNPNEPDVPPFAHTGHHDSHDTEHREPGVGHVLEGHEEGEWQQGPNGGMMYVDGADGVHFHGIDAVIHAVGEFLRRRKRIFPDGPTPTEAPRLVQEGHDAYNMEAKDPLPDIGSPEWRKTGIGPWQGFGDTKHMERKIRGPDGRLITSTFNRNGNKHHLGTHLESLANYGHLHIADAVAKATGLTRKEVQNELEMLKYPHVLPEACTFRQTHTGELEPRAQMIPENQIRDPKTGDFPEVMNLQSHHMNKFGKTGMTSEMKFPRVLATGLHEELPDSYFLRRDAQKGRKSGSTMLTEVGGRKKGLDSVTSGLGLAKQTIKQAVGAPTHEHLADRKGVQQQDPEQYRHIIWQDENGTEHSLADILNDSIEGNDARLDAMILDMQDVPALHKMFGRVQDSNSVTALDNYFLNHPDYAERAHLKSKQIAAHTGHESADNTFYHRVTRDKETGLESVVERPSSFNVHGHKGVKDAFALIQASGRNPEAGETGPQSNWRNHKLSDDVLTDGSLVNNKGAKVKFDPDSRIFVPQTRALLGGLADMVMASRGDAGHRTPVMSDEEFNEVAPVSKNQFENLKLHGESFPDYLAHRIVTPDMMNLGTSDRAVGEENLGPGVSSGKGPVKVLPRGTVTPPPTPKTMGPAMPPSMGPAMPSQPVSPETLSPGNVVPLNPVTQGLTQVQMSPEEIQRRALLSQMKPQQAAEKLQTLPFAPSKPPTTRQTNRMVAGLQPREVVDPRTGEKRMMHQSMITDWMNKSEAQERLIKMVERIQLLEASQNDSIVKHVPNTKMSENSLFDVNYMAKKMELAPADIRTILHTKGDWERVAKTYNISTDVVKVVKVSFRGD